MRHTHRRGTSAALFVLMAVVAGALLLAAALTVSTAGQTYLRLLIE